MAYNGQGLTGPGYWGYPDMLEVGITPQSQPTGVRNPSTLSWVESTSRSYFAAWCIVSSPLILGLDLTNKTNLKSVWPIISNQEAIAVNEAWAGDAGVLIKQSSQNATMPNCPHTGQSNSSYPGCSWPDWLVWEKKLPKGKVALLLMNNMNTKADVTVLWGDVPHGALRCPTQGCQVRDLHAHKDLGPFAEGFTAKGLEAHDSAFIVVSGAEDAYDTVRFSDH